MELFNDRRDAGAKLASLLEKYSHRHDCVVFGLARGGVPVAYEVARRLNVPLDVMIVRKIGVPGHEELAAGAMGPDNVVILNEDIARRVNPLELSRVLEEERKELQRREREYRGANHPSLSEQAHGKTVILVDDGLATGASMRAAVRAVRHFIPKEVVVAVPVAPPSAVEELRHEADHIVVVDVPGIFWSVGSSYNSFRQTSDSEVVRLLAMHGRDLDMNRADDGAHLHQSDRDSRAH